MIIANELATILLLGFYNYNRGAWQVSSTCAIELKVPWSNKGFSWRLHHQCTIACLRIASWRNGNYITLVPNNEEYEEQDSTQPFCLFMDDYALEPQMDYHANDQQADTSQAQVNVVNLDDYVHSI